MTDQRADHTAFLSGFRTRTRYYSKQYGWLGGLLGGWLGGWVGLTDKCNALGDRCIMGPNLGFVSGGPVH